jgi:DNA-binding MarR family transcriptional regulator
VWLVAIVAPVSGDSDYLDQVARIQAEWGRERPDLDVRAHGVIVRVIRIAAIYNERLTAIYKEFGLSLGEFDVLVTLRRTGEPFERAPHELATFAMVTTGGMTKRIDRLEQRGLVTRRPSDIDGRGRVVGLTPAGRELIDRVFVELVRDEDLMLKDLPSAVFSRLERDLATWLSAAEQTPGA